MRRPKFGAMTALMMIPVLACTMWAAWGQAPQTAPANVVAASAAPSKGKTSILEGYPNRIQARLEQRRRAFSKAPSPTAGFTPHFVIRITTLWKNGQTIKIAFRGGDKVLHKSIADAVTEWTKYANLKFDFGLDPKTEGYRTWNVADKTYAADIRVSFDQPGYYSLVGNDSVNKQISKTGEESLNLEGFDQNLPADWKAVALHEFGHAIGFEHEHQGPNAMCDFRFDDDLGYVATTDGFGQFIPDASGKRPGLYTFLGGPPNNWPQAVVDFNLKQLPKSSAYVEGPFDKKSIMKYFFEDFMFVSGKSSDCYTDSENLVPSDQDKVGAAKVYPRAPAAIAADVELRTKVLQDIGKMHSMPAAMKEHFQQTLQSITDK